MKKLNLLLIITVFILAGCRLTEAAPTGENQNLTPTDSPSTPSPTPEERQIDFLPVGFAVQRSCQKNDPCQVDGQSLPDGSELLLYPASGEMPAAIYLSPMVEAVHIASPVDFSNLMELVILVREMENSQFQILRNGEVIQILEGRNVARLAGVPAQQVFAMTYMPGSTDSGFSEIQVYPGQGPVATASGPEWLLIPLEVSGNGFAPPENEFVDLWYTYQPYGIGGEIVFPPYQGLYYLGGSGPAQQILPQEVQFSAISVDHRFVAYTQPPVSGLVIKDLQSGAETSIPLLVDSDRGAGDAVFSPDATLVAWMEASGSLMDASLAPTIRVASVNGDLVTEFSSTALFQAAGAVNVLIKPVSWIDNQRLMLEVNIPRDMGEKLLLVAHTDGSIETQPISGVFVGMLYTGE